MRSSWTRDRSRVPCFGRKILNHWTTKEVPNNSFYVYFYAKLCICTFWKTWSAFYTHSLSFCLVGSDTWLPWFPTRIISVWHLKTNHTIVHASSMLSPGWGVCTNGPISKDEEGSSLSPGFHFSANGTEAWTCKTSRFVSKWKPNVLNPRGVLGPLSASLLAGAEGYP